VVESQRPERVPFDLAAELHLKFDGGGRSAYRKAMRSLGLGHQRRARGLSGPAPGPSGPAPRCSAVQQSHAGRSGARWMARVRHGQDGGHHDDRRHGRSPPRGTGAPRTGTAADHPMVAGTEEKREHARRAAARGREKAPS